MKKYTILITLLVGIVNLFACSKKIDFKMFEKENMVEIIPKGQRRTLTNFAGTEGPQDICAYSIGKYEVTQELYQAVTGKKTSSHQTSDYQEEKKLPVENITWYDAVYFCNELTKMTMGEKNCYYSITDIKKNYDHIIFATVTCDQSKKGYRLPTEAEWEYAARGGDKGVWDYKYSGSNNIDEVAWYDENSYENFKYWTNVVGTKKSNLAGLYDMSGNVWEWCWSTWSEKSSDRVLRGGSCNSEQRWCTVSYRSHNRPDSINYNCGFRICRSLDIPVHSNKISLPNFESENMVEIIPVDSKVTLEDFAGTEGSQDIFAYSMGKFEVTQELYQAVTGTNPS